MSSLELLCMALDTQKDIKRQLQAQLWESFFWRRVTRSKMALVYSVENELKYFSDTRTKIVHFGKNRHLAENDLKYFSDNQPKIGYFCHYRHAVEIGLKVKSDTEAKLYKFGHHRHTVEIGLKAKSVTEAKLYKFGHYRHAFKILSCSAQNTTSAMHTLPTL